jgi:hypothetical protein
MLPRDTAGRSPPRRHFYRHAAFLEQRCIFDGHPATALTRRDGSRSSRSPLPGRLSRLLESHMSHFLCVGGGRNLGNRAGFDSVGDFGTDSFWSIARPEEEWDGEGSKNPRHINQVSMREPKPSVQISFDQETEPVSVCVPASARTLGVCLLVFLIAWVLWSFFLLTFSSCGIARNLGTLPTNDRFF